MSTKWIAITTLNDFNKTQPINSEFNQQIKRILNKNQLSYN